MVQLSLASVSSSGDLRSIKCTTGFILETRDLDFVPHISRSSALGGPGGSREEEWNFLGISRQSSSQGLITILRRRGQLAASTHDSWGMGGPSLWKRRTKSIYWRGTAEEKGVRWWRWEEDIKLSYWSFKEKLKQLIIFSSFFPCHSMWLMGP